MKKEQLELLQQNNIEVDGNGYVILNHATAREQIELLRQNNFEEESTFCDRTSKEEQPVEWKRFKIQSQEQEKQK